MPRSTSMRVLIRGTWERKSTDRVSVPRLLIDERGGSDGGGQFRADEGFDLGPHFRVAFDLRVSFDEVAVPPGISLAGERTAFVVEAIISEDGSARGIGGANFGAAVERAVRLIKIGGLGDIGGDERVILAALSDAIHLDGEEDGNAVFFEQAGEVHGFRSAPAMPIDDDAGVSLLRRGERSVIVRVEEPQNFLMSQLAAMIFEGARDDAGGVILAELLDELHLGVDIIRVAYVAADKTDDDDRRPGESIVFARGAREDCRACGHNGGEKEKEKAKRGTHPAHPRRADNSKKRRKRNTTFVTGRGVREY